ncbi:hypothetical protein BGV40_14380 [Methanosarcina sp. Ant1]|nr:hypothetical protein BGV40_14380 [Methanosarcina sp. Ant1]
MILKRMLRDTVSPFLLSRRKQTEKENILSVEDSVLPRILRIQAEGFKNGSPEKLVNYSMNSKNISYVIKSQDKVIGYCTYYLKMKLSFKGFVKQSVISEISIDRNFRSNDFAERLLNESIE